MKSWFAFLAGLFVLLLFSPAFSAPSDLYGLRVTGIVLKDDLGNSLPKPERLFPLIVVKPGDFLTATAIRDSIANLYLMGLCRDIQVDATPDNGGVRLEFVFSLITIVDRIVVRGNSALSSALIQEALPGVEGKEFRPEKLSELRENILLLYQAEGYYDASVSFRAEPAGALHRVNLVITIRESEPTRIESIIFSENKAFSDKDLLRVMKSKKGAPLNSKLLMDSDMEAILQKYSDAGYPGARPGPVSMSFREHKAYIRISGSEGPKVLVRFSGNRGVSESKLQQALLIWSEHDISDAIIESSVDKMRNLYRDLGYADVRIDVKKTESPGQLEIEFRVQEGPRTSVDKLVIHGTTRFSERELKRPLSLREAGWFRYGPFREDLLDKDMDYLHDLYVDAGYLAVSVKKKVELRSDAKKAAVTIEIIEGPLTSVGSITFEGKHAFTDAELLDKLALKSGAPFSERLLDEDKLRIVSAYADKGYLYAKVDMEKTASGDHQDIKFRIVEDLPVTIGRIILRGNERTKDYAILRELLLKPGDPYNYPAMLTSQQRIYRLGYFGLARFEPVHSGEKDYVQDMLLTVEERPAGAVEFGIGYGDLDRLRGFVELSHRNLLGRALYGSLRLEESDILQRAVLNLQEPWFLGRRLESRLSLAWSDSKRLNQDTREIYYQTRKTSASYGVEKVVNELKASLTYQFENVENYNVNPQAVLSQDDIGRVLVSSLSPGLIWDKRDDAFNPRKGSLHGIILKEALKELGSEADFTKLTVQSSWFLPVDTGILAALSARGGMAWPHQGTTEVPLHERFYLGGSTTVRGYTQDSVGPTQWDGSAHIPTGGASMVVFNVELRMNPTEGLGFVVFTDAGNVWVDQKINLHELRSSYGTGLRYGTPIGPLRVDYGQKIHRRPGESPGEFHFNIGHAF